MHIWKIAKIGDSQSYNTCLWPHQFQIAGNGHGVVQFQQMLIQYKPSGVRSDKHRIYTSLKVSPSIIFQAIVPSSIKLK